MPEPGAARAAFVDFALRPSTAAFTAIADPAARIDINLRGGTVADLVEALAGLDPSQRAGLTALGDNARTVLIFPARTGRPETRRLFTATHPAGRITEVTAYTDDLPPPVVLARAPGTPATRAVPELSPHKAAGRPRVLVTASTEGLGRVIAEAFVARGASVAFHGRRPGFEPAAANDGARVVYLAADLGRPGSEDELAEAAAVALGGPVTVLVNNLGPWDGTQVSQVSQAAWAAALQTGVTAQLRLAQLVAPGMRELGQGRIVNVTSASTGKRSHGTYGFVKAALEFLTEALAAELAPEITVNAVAPGQIEESVPLMNSLNPSAVPAMLAATPLRRFVTRAEVAAVVADLALNPAYATMTGATVPLAGGYQLTIDEGA